MDWHQLLVRGFSEPQDPRVGSGRDGSSGGTLSTSSSNKGNSLSKLGATFGPVGIYLGACLVAFILLRPRFQRVYAPKSIPGLQGTVPPTPQLPNGYFNWFIPFFKIPDTYVLNYGSLDAFFFLRYLKVLRNISIAGIVIVWPVLLPINATGGNKLDQLEQLTIGNVLKGSLRHWAHATVAWVFFGFVIFTIIRECIYFINLRQAYLTSPYYSDRLCSRTMLLLCVPIDYRDEARLRKLYGDSARRIFVPRSSKALAKLVKEREQTALRLEKAHIDLIRKANAARLKYYRKSEKSMPTTAPSTQQTDPESSTNDSKNSNSSETVRRLSGMLKISLPASKQLSETKTTPVENNDDTRNEEDEKAEELDYIHPYGLRPDLPDVRGSVAAQWLPAEQRPYHRPIGNYGRRVDTIRWCRKRLRELNLLIFKMRRQVRRGDADPLPAAFIEFDTQEAAQAAQQVVIHHRPLQMSPGLLGIRPDEVIWEVLRMKWWERIVRRLLIMAFITAAIVFWSIPSAFIGIISNIDFLTNIVFLHWVKSLPSYIKGLIGGFLPPLLLSLLMSIVPYLLRKCAAQAGIPSLVLSELFTQNAYFAFQVVQVFLITTLTSAASGALESIVQNPLSAQKLLAQNLPKASNFYLSYILIQCLATGGSALLQFLSLIRHGIVARVTDIPRKKFNTWKRLKPARWGAIFPVFTNMGVIALSYACIAPLILVFAAGGMAFMRLVWKYNLIYVFDTTTDSKGQFYPRALQHLFVGLYLAEICLVGLLALSSAFGPMGMVIALLLVTGLIHMNLSDAILPLTLNLPQTLPLEEEIQAEKRARAEAAAGAEITENEGGAAASYYNMEEAFGDEEEEIEVEETDGDEHVIVSNRAMEGADSIRSALTAWFKASTKQKIKNEVEEAGMSEHFSKFFSWFSKGDGEHPPGFLAKWFHPAQHEDFIALRNLFPKERHPDIVYSESSGYSTYQPPELWQRKPTLWIPRDEARVSRQEVAQTREYTPITDLGATLNGYGRIEADLTAAPIEVPKFVSSGVDGYQGNEVFA